MAADAELHRTIAARLAASDQVYTANRRAVVEALLGAAGPITLPELLAADRSLAQSSAYRSLAVLVDAGVVRRLVHGADHAHYEMAEPMIGHHHHLICDHCGFVADVTLPEQVESAMDRSFEAAAARHGFRAGRHSIDIFGLCASCAEVQPA